MFRSNGCSFCHTTVQERIRTKQIFHFAVVIVIAHEQAKSVFSYWWFVIICACIKTIFFISCGDSLYQMEVQPFCVRLLGVRIQCNAANFSVDPCCRWCGSCTGLSSWCRNLENVPLLIFSLDKERRSIPNLQHQEPTQSSANHRSILLYRKKIFES